jgi:pterin-4a-carbinolamine dehydratase
VKLKKLHESYIESSRRPMDLGRLPISPKDIELPVVPMDKWVLKGDPKKLVKTFRFRRPGDRNMMIQDLLEYEEEVQHHADMVIKEDTLQIEIYTKNVELVTEIDKEYAKQADQIFKNIVYMSADIAF